MIKTPVALISMLKSMFTLLLVPTPHLTTVCKLQEISMFSLAPNFAPASFLYVWLQHCGHIETFIARNIMAG